MIKDKGVSGEQIKMKKTAIKRRAFIVLLISAVVLAAVMIIFLNSPSFGRLPSGDRLKNIEASANYINGRFQNQVPTSTMQDDQGFLSGIWEMFFGADKRAVPDTAIPTEKTDLFTLPNNENIIVWMGHSSLYLQLDGLKILVDPVFSAYASPVPFVNRAFEGTDIYSVEDMPEIDILLISHDHWDHLDYATVTALKPKVKQVICPLGVGSHFQHWNYDMDIIHESDWNTATLLDTLTIHTLPARHFSGRSLVGNKTLWASYLLQTSNNTIYLSGDTGYGPHFSEIGARFGAIDVALIENGQYNGQRWPDIHMLPEQIFLAAEELHAKQILPIHAGKFSISMHAWDEPYEVLCGWSKNTGIQLLTPLIGQPVYINQTQSFTQWWKMKNI